jgi:hypothetical protein
VKKSSVFEWYKKFREGSEDVEGAERSVWECRGPIKMLKMQNLACSDETKLLTRCMTEMC